MAWVLLLTRHSRCYVYFPCQRVLNTTYERAISSSQPNTPKGPWSEFYPSRHCHEDTHALFEVQWRYSQGIISRRQIISNLWDNRLLWSWQLASLRVFYLDPTQLLLNQ